MLPANHPAMPPKPDPKRPAAEPTRTPLPDAEQPTIVANLSGTDPTAIPGVVPSAETVATANVRPANARPGVPTDPQDVVRTVVAGSRPPGHETDVTHLHVDGTRAPGITGSGTHKGQIWGDFAFVRLLGKGGMGAVYLGRQLSLDRPVAIKVLPPHLSENAGFKARFQLEAKAVAQISSPNVIQVYAAGEHEGNHYFAMEFVEGQDLSQRLKGGWRPTRADAVELVLQAARGLAAAGEHGIVHRDIKPGNMMIDRKGTLKLMDFGLVKLAAENHSLTMTGTVMGTVSYFSPEQGRGQPCDQRTDLYALGVVFYEMLTGKLPFTGTDATSVIYQHIHVAPVPPRQVDATIPEPWQSVILRLMAKQAEDRYQTATDLVADLERLKAGQPLPRTAAAGGAKRRPVALIAAGAAALIVVAGIACWAMWTPAPLPAPPAKLIVAVVPPTEPVPVVKPVIPVLEPVRPEPTRPEPVKPVVVQPEPVKPEPMKPEPVKPVVIPVVPVAAPPVEPVAKPVEPVAKPVEPAPAPPVKPVKTEPDPRVLVRTNILARDWIGARRVIELNRSSGDAAQWAALAKEVDTGEGTDLLAKAQAAFTARDYDNAGRTAVAAQALIPESPELRTLLEAIKARDGARKQQQQQLTKAEALLGEGKPVEAEVLLKELQTASPDDPQIANALGRATAMKADQEQKLKAAREQLDRADQAMAIKDHDTALSAYTAALQLNPREPRASQGLEAVNKAKADAAAAFTAFEKSLAAKDLAGAERDIARLREIAPRSLALLNAEQKLKDSRLHEEAAKAKAAAEEARKAALATAVLATCDDASKDIPELERALNEFLATAGADRPERKAIETKIEDRRSRIQFTAALAGLDQTMAGKGGDLATIVTDATYLTSLKELAAESGLTFAHKILDFQRTGDTGTARVSIRIAMPAFPERTLIYRYELARTGTNWRVTAAKTEDSK